MKYLALAAAAAFLFGCNTAPIGDVPTVVDPIVVKAPARAETVKALSAIGAGSSCAKYVWLNRGRAPAGYMKGFPILYAKQYCNQFRSDVKVASRPPQGANDVLVHYKSLLDNAGLSGHPELRKVYTIMIGLGMRESSGKYCVGRDMSANFSSATSAESGWLQTSLDASGRNPELPKIVARHKTPASKATCDLAVWKEGASCSSGDAKNWGDPASAGYQFQAAQKSCPVLAGEFGAVVMRVSGGPTGHYGPLRRKEAQVRPECASMLQAVEKYIDANPLACNGL